jgi:hypothetical protein
MKFISCISLVLLTIVSAQACDPHNNSGNDKGSFSNPQLTPMIRWLSDAKRTLEENDFHYIKYSGDNLWLYTPDQVPFAIFKPLQQDMRCHGDKDSWRKIRNLTNEIACVTLARYLQLGKSIPFNFPIPHPKFKIIFNNEVLEGLLEAPINLLDLQIANQDTPLAQFGKFLLKLEEKYLNIPIHNLSLADLNDFIDADFGKRREKLIDSQVRRLKIKGSEDFHYNHYQFFLQHINQESLFRVAILDMLLFHRDLKPDNILLHITNTGIHFVATDFEYAMYPFTASAHDDESKDNTPIPISNVTRVNFLPFYVDFPQSYEVLPASYFKLITGLNFQKINEFLNYSLNNSSSRRLHPEGIKDFKSRFTWLFKVAQDIVSGTRRSLSLRQLHKEFKYTFGLKGKFYKDSRHRVKARYFYTPQQFALLNPERPQYPQEELEDLDSIHFEKKLEEKCQIIPNYNLSLADLIDDNCDSGSESSDSGDIHLDGYTTKLN